MIVYIPVGNGPVRREYIAAGAGMIVTRADFRFPKLDCPWIFDNGAFQDYLDGKEFGEVKFVRCIDRLMKVQPCQRPAWCVTPDIVADKNSLGFSVGWRKDLPHALNWYLALQDGMEEAHVENALSTAKFSGLFVGGSLTWKNENAARWCAFGRAYKLPVHIGRLNGGRRLQWAVNIGASSVDGTGWTQDSRWVHWVRSVRHPEGPEGLLFDDVAQDLESHRRAAKGRKAGAG